MSYEHLIKLTRPGYDVRTRLQAGLAGQAIPDEVADQLLRVQKPKFSA